MSAPVTSGRALVLLTLISSESVSGVSVGTNWSPMITVTVGPTAAEDKGGAEVLLEAGGVLLSWGVVLFAEDIL